MQNAYSINKSDTLNFVNKSLVNGLSGQGTERRAREDTFYIAGYVNMERAKATLITTFPLLTEQPDKPS